MRLDVVLADAPSDVLVWLHDHGPSTPGEIAAGVAPQSCGPCESDMHESCERARRGLNCCCNNGEADE